MYEEVCGRQDPKWESGGVGNSEQKKQRTWAGSHGGLTTKEMLHAFVADSPGHSGRDVDEGAVWSE